MATRTGSFPIGFRRGWSDWQKKDLKPLVQWASGVGFEALDLAGRITLDEMKVLKDAGLRIGSLDLLDFGQLMSSDEGKRKELIGANVKYVKEHATAGSKIFFTCIIPGDVTKKRAENYKLAVEVFSPIADACLQHGASLVIEGYPGPAPHIPNLCCNPETYRAFLKDVKGTSVNYDPSHLIRLRIDHIRFLKEFAPQVRHVHAKDTDIDENALYEFGTQTAAFAEAHRYGEWGWRYTIPGHGQTRWSEAFNILKETGFRGVVSIELEDENFNGTEDGEKAALKYSLEFLRSV